MGFTHAHAKLQRVLDALPSAPEGVSYTADSLPWVRRPHTLGVWFG